MASKSRSFRKALICKGFRVLLCPFCVVAGGTTLCYIPRDFARPDLGWGQTCPISSGNPGMARGANDIGRVDVTEPASISTGIAERYATAVFELVKAENALTTLETDIAVLDDAMGASDALSALIYSPVYSREEQGKAVSALAAKMDLSSTMTNTLGLLAANRRLFVLPQLLLQLREMIAEDKGEVTAEVMSAKALTKAQSDKLAAQLTTAVGKTVALKTAVDESLIGGLIVKVGSKMIDTTVKSKLNALQNTMKEVG